MDALFVAACAAAGAAVGAFLDPIGQLLADRSEVAEERDRAEREIRRAERDVVPDVLLDRADPGSGAAEAAEAGPRPIPELDGQEPVGVPELLSDAVVVDAAPAPGDPSLPVVRHLLPAGHSLARTLGAAVVTGALWAAVARHFGTHPLVIPYLTFMAMAVTVAITDLTHRLVPRRLIYAGLLLIGVALMGVSLHDHNWHQFTIAVIGGAIAFGAFFLIWFIVPRGMGFGDVRLAGVIGLTVGYLGLVHVYLAFLSGFVLGLLFGLALMIGASSGRKTRIPFAPSLVAGTTIAILWGGTIGQNLFHTAS